MRCCPPKRPMPKRMRRRQGSRGDELLPSYSGGRPVAESASQSGLNRKPRNARAERAERQSGRARQERTTYGKKRVAASRVARSEHLSQTHGATHFTDPESRIMPDGGTKQFRAGYNAQIGRFRVEVM